MNNRFLKVWFHFFKCLTIVLLLICISSPLKAQTFTYDAFVNHEKVGELKVVKEVNDEAERITVRGYYEINLDSLIKFEFGSKSVYMDGVLKESESFTSSNYHKQTSVSIWQEGEHYVKKYDTLDFNLPFLVEEVYGLDLFFFEEPKGITHAYSLLTGQKYWIDKAHNFSYLMKRLNPDKSSDSLFIAPFHTFHYENGMLKEYSDAFSGMIITFKLQD